MRQDSASLFTFSDGCDETKPLVPSEAGLFHHSYSNAILGISSFVDGILEYISVGGKNIYFKVIYKTWAAALGNNHPSVHLVFCRYR